MKKVFICVLIGIFLFTISPVQLIAQATKSATDACAQGQMDAGIEVNKFLWGAVGFLLGIVGVLIAYMVPPSPPAMKLMGKSSEYVLAYTQCYQDKGKGEQGTASLIGCAISGVLVTIYYIWAIATVTAAASSIR